MGLNPDRSVWECMVHFLTQSKQQTALKNLACMSSLYV